MAVSDDDMIETPWGKKRWTYLKHTMELEQWLMDHVPQFSNAIMCDLDAEGMSAEELDKIAEEFSDAHPNIGTWFHELYTAVFTDPEKYKGRLN